MAQNRLRNPILSKKITPFAVALIATGLIGSAYAHKAQVVGDYRFEAGWVKEPPMAKKENGIEILVTKAPSAEKQIQKTKEKHGDSHDTDKKSKSSKKQYQHGKSKMSGISGIKDLEITVTLNGKKTLLQMTEDKKTAGRYTAPYTPQSSGHPTVHVYAKINGADLEATIHPKKVKP